MKSWLTVQSDKLDEALLAKQLQLRGSIVDSVWRFEMPKRLLKLPVAQHVQHWTNLLQKHAEGRRVLQRLGYEFCLHFLSEKEFLVAFTLEEVDLVARTRCGIKIECYDVG